MKAETAKKLLAGFVFAIVTGLAVVAAQRVNLLPAAPDKFTYDWRTYLLAEQAKQSRTDIAIIMINEKSLTGYEYLSPVDRGLLAELVKSADEAGAKAIGLDFVLDRRTETKKDDDLLQAIRNSHAPVVLAALDYRSAEDEAGKAFQEDFIRKSGKLAGHPYFAADPNTFTLSDQAVRYLSPPGRFDDSKRPSIDRILANIDGEKQEPASRLIYWRRPLAENKADLFPTFMVPVHRAEDGSRKGPALPQSWRSALAGKIVLIGGGFRDRDLHLTPLTVASGKRVHGVEIHAQILAQLRDERSIYPMRWWIEFMVAAFVTILGILAARYWTLTGGGVISTGIALVVMILGGGLLFWSTHIILPSATLFLAWAAGLFAGNPEGWLAKRLDDILGTRTEDVAVGG